MSSAHNERSRVGGSVPRPRRRGVPSAMLAAVAMLGSALVARAATGTEPPTTPAPEPASSRGAAERRLSLDLDRVLAEREGGHAEFDLRARRAIWDDRMIRLDVWVAREGAAARRGGLVGLPVPFSSSNVLIHSQDADPRLVLAGPFAADWAELTPQEKVGRVAETVVTYGILFEILRALGGGGNR